MTFLQKIPKWLKNKFALAATAFIIWMVFFDQYDVIQQLKLSSELKQLEKGKVYYTREIEEIKDELKELDNNPATLEKAARERFYMKKDNEDVFIVETK